MTGRRRSHGVHVAGLFLLALLLAAVLAPYEKNTAPRLPSDSQAAFDETFEYVRSIELPEDAPHVISDVEVGDSGRLLLIDPSSDAVLFNWTDGTRISLGEHVCDDGVPWAPRIARFAPDGSIIVVSRADGYRFTADGICSHRLHDAFSPPGSFDVTSDGNLVAYRYLPPPPIVTVHDSSGKLLYSRSIEVERPALNGRISDGSIATGDGWIFVSRPLNPHVVRMSLDGSAVSNIGWRPRTYRVYLGHDLAQGAFVQDVFDPAQYISRHTISEGVLYVGNGVVVHQHANQYRRPGRNDRYSINLMDLDGQPLSDAQLMAATPFIAARDGYLFRWAARSDADHPRAVDVYRLREKLN